ncbi:unnamed protein product [Cuscuta campestris]|uniref:Uncharacterized protein n=1 Tax=Cuscuta campestris TaxID=132261 RepID=A0A484KU02_9ASTE|nr:unnamed protein product [Cuscuta campestris]
MLTFCGKPPHGIKMTDTKARCSAEVEADDIVGSSEQRPLFNLEDSDDDNPIPRPIGRKKAKFIVPRVLKGPALFILTMISVGQWLNNFRCSILGIRLEERENRSKEKTDLDTLTGFKRMYYERRQNEIMDKYNLLKYLN